MRAAIAILLAACASGEPTLNELAADAGPPLDAAAGPIALSPGSYELTWTCIDGCRPLLFPPSSYTELEAVSGEVTFYTAGMGSAKVVAMTNGACASVEALVYENGSTNSFEFCPAAGGPEAQVVYSATSGPDVDRTYAVTATPE